MAIRLAGAAIGVLCVEASVFRVILPVMCAGVIAGLDAAWPTRGPAAWLVLRFGRPPVRWVAPSVVRSGQAVLAGLCVAAVVADAAGAHTVCWVLAAVVGALGLFAAAAGRPALGARMTRFGAGPSD
jgi:hypothetical protein